MLDSTQLKQALGNGNEASYRPKEQIDSLNASLCIRPQNQSQFRRMNAGKNPLHACGFQPEHALEQACEHRPVVGQNRIVAVLKQACLLDLDLFAEDAAA